MDFLKSIYLLTKPENSTNVLLRVGSKL